LSSEPPKTTVPLTPAFKLVFLAVLALTVLSLVGAIFLALAIKDPTDSQKSVIETVTTTYKIGFGAIAGLVGGKFS
jgi:hypothetical protein